MECVPGAVAASLLRSGVTRAEDGAAGVFEGKSGGRMGCPVFGWIPARKDFSCPFMPPAIHLPSCLPLHDWVRSLGADSAKAPHATHQWRVPLTTVQWLLKQPAAVGRFFAFAFQLMMTGPVHAREVMFDCFVDLMVQVVHHQPTSMG